MGDMLKVVDDDGSGYTMVRPICCSVQTFKYSNICWGVLSSFVLMMGLLGLLVNSGGLVVLPPESYLAMLILGGLSLLTVACGMVGQGMKIELFFLIYIFFMALELIGQTLGFSFLLLYANDVASINKAQDAAIDAQNVFEDNLIEFARGNAADWLKVQNKLDCCGIDFEEGLNAADALILETGARCAEGQAVIDNLRQLFILNENGEQDRVDEFGNFIDAKLDPVIGFEAEFFCKSKISAAIQKYTPLIAVIVGLLLLIQITALVSASRLYWVPEFLGGWQFDDEELEAVAKRKGIPFQNTATVAPGGGLLNTIRNQTNRLSFRFRNAYTADPDAPANAGFFGRLSLNRNRTSFGGGGHGSFRGNANTGPNTFTDPAASSAIGMPPVDTSGAGRPAVASGKSKTTFMDLPAAPPGLANSGKAGDDDDDW